MISEEAVRNIMKKKLRRLIRDDEYLLAFRRPLTGSDAYELSETAIEKLKLQLELNSLMLEDAKNDGEKKKLLEEKKDLKNALALELRDGVEILEGLIANLRKTGAMDSADELEVIMDVRRSELDRLAAEK